MENLEQLLYSVTPTRPKDKDTKNNKSTACIIIKKKFFMLKNLQKQNLNPL